MKKALMSAILLVLALAVTSAPSTEAQPCIRCSNFYAWTPGQWGMASTCEQAEQNAILNAYYWTYGACGVDGPCDWGAEEIVTPCMWDGTQWKADGRVQYKCTINMCM